MWAWYAQSCRHSSFAIGIHLYRCMISKTGDTLESPRTTSTFPSWKSSRRTRTLSTSPSPPPGKFRPPKQCIRGAVSPRARLRALGFQPSCLPARAIDASDGSTRNRCLRLPTIFERISSSTGTYYSSEAFTSLDGQSSSNNLSSGECKPSYACVRNCATLSILLILLPNPPAPPDALLLSLPAGTSS